MELRWSLSHLSESSVRDEPGSHPRAEYRAFSGLILAVFEWIVDAPPLNCLESRFL
jgi:hypothetical protein